MSELLSCPFCGKTPRMNALYHLWRKEFWVTCSCGISAKHHETKKEATRKWNTRVRRPLTPELPGCPFCGSRRVKLLPNFGNRVVCNDCTAEAHIDDWKRRVISARLLTKMSQAANGEEAYEVLLEAGYTALMGYGDSNE